MPPGITLCALGSMPMPPYGICPRRLRARINNDGHQRSAVRSSCAVDDATRKGCAGHFGNALRSPSDQRVDYRRRERETWLADLRSKQIPLGGIGARHALARGVVKNEANMRNVPCDVRPSTSTSSLGQLASLLA